MPKNLREAPITTRASRANLTPGVHWRLLDPDTHLGYRKAKRGGRWLVRSYEGDGAYRQQTIGTADDVISEGTLTFEAACKAAREAVVRGRRAAAATAAGPAVTVRDAVHSYIARQNARARARAGRDVRSTADGRLAKHVLCNDILCGTPLYAMTEEVLRTWREGLTTGKASPRKRLVADLKAALNMAVSEGRRGLPADLPLIIKHGLATPDAKAALPTEVVARDNQILSDQEVRWLIEAARQIDSLREWDGDLLQMIVILAATGARFSQVQRLPVQDLQIIASRVMMPSSAKGRKKGGRHVPVPVGKDVIEIMRPALAGRGKTEMFLGRWHHRQNGPGKWVRVERRPWRASHELTKVFKLVAERAGLSGYGPYSLRHSSIVRHLRMCPPIRLVAALHDAGARDIELALNV